VTAPLLDVRDLKKHFPVRQGIFGRVAGWVRAVDGISFTLAPGETLGLVGESGCGKTTAGRSLLRLVEPTSGRVLYRGTDLLALDAAGLRRARRDLQIIFQDPYGSLNPRMTVGAIVAEGLVVHGIGTRAERAELVRETLARVGLDPAWAHRYPHEFSGGQRQRVGIARALVLNPKFIVCDEPVSALDVSVQSQVVNLLVELREKYGIAYLFISHDLRVVKYISDRVAVMYLGEIVETAATDEIYRRPLHPYTEALLSAVPVPDPERRRARILLPGDVPSPLHPPSGCRFHPRCPKAIRGLCDVVAPPLKSYDGHEVACHVVERELTGKISGMPEPPGPVSAGG
jgi:peptide/nickel transport system ATP-binding protein/oligopeptide transport system ATP-binding protein